MADILIVDDDPILVEILGFNLEAAGHSICVAKNGEEALTMLEGKHPDLLILDSMMPIMSGPEVLSAMKSDPNLENIPVLMLTARDRENDVVSALQSGADEYMTKPFIPQELIARIDTIFRRRK